MPIDLNTVLRTAELARLDLTYGLSEAEAPAALNKLADEMAGIVAHIDILSQADTEGVEPLYSPMLEPPEPRQDIAVNSGLTEEMLNQAPDRLGDMFVVPKIL